MTFKEITWQTLRIEADASDSGDQDLVTTPLRLITNQGRIQIALKRRVSVFSVLEKLPISVLLNSLGVGALSFLDVIGVWIDSWKSRTCMSVLQSTQ